MTPSLESNTPEVEVLKRLNQIAVEIRFALQRGKIEIASEASSLLAPTLMQWQDTPPVDDAEREIRAAIITEIQLTLAESEQHLNEKMLVIGSRLGALSRGKRTIAVVRSQNPRRMGRVLDSKR